MPKNEKRVKVTLACEDCKRRNYITIKSRVNDRERIEMKKYCRWDKRHTRPQGDPLARPVVRRAPGAPGGVTFSGLTRVEAPHPEREDRLDEAELIGAAEGGRPASVRRAGAAHLRRHVHARASPHRQRGGRARRGAGGLPAGLARASGSSAARRRSRRGCTASPPTRPRRTCKRRRRQQAEPFDDDLEPADQRAELPARGDGASRPRRSSGSRSPLDELPAEAAQRRRAEGRLRPVARGDRRRARHHGRRRRRCGCTGAAASCATCCTTKEPKPMRCDEVTALLPGLVDGERDVDLDGRAPHRDVPALPGRARPLPAAAADARAAAHPLRRADARPARRDARRAHRRGRARRAPHARSRAGGSRTPARSAALRSPPGATAALLIARSRQAGPLRLAG